MTDIENESNDRKEVNDAVLELYQDAAKLQEAAEIFNDIGFVFGL